MTYASKTKVSADQSRSEIERTLKRYGADRFAYFNESSRAIIVFEAHNRRIRFDLPLPEGDTEKTAQVVRQRWRALLLCIKAKLESVESKIESFESAFLAHVVLPDGRTVGDAVENPLAQIYSGGNITPLLPDYSGAKDATER
jgi:hypothetical protein